MYIIKSLPSFTTWLENLDDKIVKANILGRIKRLELGLKGDTKYVGDSVSELRIAQKLASELE